MSSTPTHKNSSCCCCCCYCFLRLPPSFIFRDFGFCHLSCHWMGLIYLLSTHTTALKLLFSSHRLDKLFSLGVRQLLYATYYISFTTLRTHKKYMLNLRPDASKWLGTSYAMYALFNQYLRLLASRCRPAYYSLRIVTFAGTKSILLLCPSNLHAGAVRINIVYIIICHALSALRDFLWLFLLISRFVGWMWSFLKTPMTFTCVCLPS